MAASHQAVEHMVKIMLKYMDRKDALRMARDIYSHVKGNQSMTETFHRIVEELIDREE
jgi:transcription elongation factor GreA-like protein